MLIRSTAFGFLGGREVKEAGVANLGLLDRKYPKFLGPQVQMFTDLPTEREALQWIQKYIPAFGGDPTKVMMYVSECTMRPADTDHILPVGARALVRSASGTTC